MADVPRMHEPEEDPVPVFRTWPRIYAAVIVVNLISLALIALFSAWPF